MGKLIVIIPILFVLITISSKGHSQDSVVSSGNDISGNGGTVSYSVGQVEFNTYSGINGSVAQGVQQAYEIFGTDYSKGISLKFIAYPNPSTDFLILKIENFTNEKFMCQLFDMKGRLLMTRNIDNVETTIPMQEYVSATYYLKITEDQSNVKTFKIIKH